MEPHLRSIAAELGLGGDVQAVMAIRRDWTLESLVPRADAIPTLEELRRRGHKLGMISVCSDDVPEVWDRTPFATLFDSTVFSCSVGFSKPDPRIYLVAADELGVEPEDCLFVGDGANDELPGAERAGMTALQLRAPGEQLTAEGERWSGRYVGMLSDVLELA
jgi:putative hydrolase of the HAD superfamily